MTEQPISSTTLDSNFITFNGHKGQERHNKLVAFVKSQHDKIKSNRSQLERQWYLNMAMYAGRQNVVAQSLNAGGGQVTRLVTPKAPYWRVRMVVNKVRPTIRTELAKLTASKPNASVIPASSDDDDLFASYAGEQIWESFYQNKKANVILRRALFWTLLTGNGFIKDYWDQSIIDTESQTQGDIQIEPVTPFHIFVPSFVEEEIENQPFAIHAMTKTVDWVALRFEKGLNGKDIKPDTVDAGSILNNAFLNLIGAKQNVADMVLCYELWAKPGELKEFPNGVMLTLVGDQIVQAFEGFPYQHGDYPFTKFEHIPTGKFYAESVITDLIPIQREYNRTRSQIIEAKNRMAKPQLLAPAGSINVAKITTEPGQVIEYKLGYNPPTPLPLQALPSYVLQELDRSQIDWDDISRQHEVTRGQVPPGVTAATAISFLQEQDDTALSHTVDSIERGMEKIAKHVLSYAVQFWDVPRMIKTVGSDGSFDTLMLKGSALRGNTDIRMEAGSGLPTSKAAKQAFILDLMKMGFIDPNKGLEVMQIGGIQKIYDQIQVDTRQAQRENLRLKTVSPEIWAQHQEAQMMNMMQVPDVNAPQMPFLPNDPSTVPPEGSPVANTMQPGATLPALVPVNDWDNHAVHIDTHNKYRKSQQYELLPQEAKMAFEEHVQHHKAALMVTMPPPVAEDGTEQQQGAQSNQFDGLLPQSQGDVISNG